jgi:hypothetical protein
MHIANHQKRIKAQKSTIRPKKTGYKEQVHVLYHDTAWAAGEGLLQNLSDEPRPIRDLGKLSGLSWTEGPSACVQQVRSALIYFSYV